MTVYLGCKHRNTIFSCKSEVTPLLFKCLFAATVHHVLYPRGVAGTPGCMQLSDACCAYGGLLLRVAFLLLGVKEGILWKRGRDNGQFLPRKFLLSEREGCLKYFTKQDVSMVVNSHLSEYSTQGRRVTEMVLLPMHVSEVALLIPGQR